MNKHATIIIIAVAVVGILGYWLATNQQLETQEFCIQVITRAQNPKTDEIRDFPTPCDVPEGWDVLPPEQIDSLGVVPVLE
ncbi:MAG: hypothetical protein AAB407_03335 [Patescibacteria group bacterium]